MQVQQAILTFTEAERPLGERLLKLAVEIDRIEGYSEPHSVVIARFSEKLGAMMGLHGSDLSSLKFAALIHDIGERQTKRNYLLRPDALTWEERLDLWRHPILGEQASAELRLPRHTQLMIRWHHEWWNGLGYPDGLSGDSIPLGARILRAVDSFYALVSTRPHRQRFDLREAEQIIADLAGIEFDPMVVKVLLTALQEERKGHATGYWASEAILGDVFQTPLAPADPLSIPPDDDSSPGLFDETPPPFPEKVYFPSATPWLSTEKPILKQPEEEPVWSSPVSDPVPPPFPQPVEADQAERLQADFPDDAGSPVPPPPTPPPLPTREDRPASTVEPVGPNTRPNSNEEH
jgi:hypothetical protein